MTVQPETERRFIVYEHDPLILQAPKKHIYQGYFETPADFELRVRIINDTSGRLTRKDGSGLTRPEDERPIDLELARFLMNTTQDRLRKVRHVLDGWEFDVYEPPLEGLRIVEFEHPDAAAANLPSWIHRAREVTGILTNRHLARLATELLNANVDRPIHSYLERRLASITLTGADCSGKSTLLRELAGAFGDRLSVEPETASIVITQVGVAPPSGDLIALQRFQRTLYRAQVSFEEISEMQAMTKQKVAMLHDRGTRDSVPYFPGGEREFNRICRTTRDHEFGRYDLVIYLAPPPREVFEQVKHGNAARPERSYEELLALSQRTFNAWQGHPNLVRADGATWEEKSDLVHRVVRDFLSRC
jgi:CYTH domain-containing protein/predicted ATPase